MNIYISLYDLHRRSSTLSYVFKAAWFAKYLNIQEYNGENPDVISCGYGLACRIIWKDRSTWTIH